MFDLFEKLSASLHYFFEPFSWKGLYASFFQVVISLLLSFILDFALVSFYELGYFCDAFFFYSVLYSDLWIKVFQVFLLGISFRLMSRVSSRAFTTDSYNLFTPTCTSSFYPDDHLGRFMGFSRFVELKSARFVERLRKIKEDIIRDIMNEKKKIFINREGTFLLLRVFDSMFPLASTMMPR